MDTENLLKSLSAHAVDYVIVGDAAFRVHGYPRTTLAIDLFIRPDPVNAIRVIEALREFGYDITDLTVEDLLANKVLIRQQLVETNIHPFVTGITFDQIWRTKISNYYGHTLASFASLNDLITMELAANRPND